MTGPLVLATRGSALALVQTETASALLKAAWPGLVVERKVVRTTGDERAEENLATMGGSGVFTMELERELMSGGAHAAVHSLKDLPVMLPPGLVLGAVLPRGNPADVLVSAHPCGVDALPAGSRVGTGSPRRAAMFLTLRSDVRVEPVRGNVPTRLAKVVRGEFDAVILAAAGLERLGLTSHGSFTIEGGTLHAAPLPSFLPAPGQGAIALEIREDDAQTREMVGVIHEDATAAAVQAERAVLAALGGGCHLALGALAVVGNGQLRLEAEYFPGADAAARRASVTGLWTDAEKLGRELGGLLHG
ncbi:MAG: hydroxymethylbilane synthase [Chthoniobacterales bacterium]